MNSLSFYSTRYIVLIYIMLWETYSRIESMQFLFRKYPIFFLFSRISHLIFFSVHVYTS
ncbi:uncharacterized protein B0P05DRAFT_549143 [Gilbertella persicaria]|uniref:uncharacterized protein n=1 Tax=Gilbertella persicaria TaxID=101096 RepID=UPI00221EB986|nr:uncharacterized protein B0P05DRAFT_549143 [Gilbertella persicaria]KAI8072164.1 hypothetical protein B0P05DRAFT_549143 [Gilbertella persicaria]